jgi:hypothetical protein
MILVLLLRSRQPLRLLLYHLQRARAPAVDERGWISYAVMHFRNASHPRKLPKLAHVAHLERVAFPDCANLGQWLLSYAVMLPWNVSHSRETPR